MISRLVVTDRGVGRLEDDVVLLLDSDVQDLGDALAAGLTLEQIAASDVRERVAIADVRLHAPIARPRQIWAVGLNYRAHVDEIKGMDLTEPFIFPKSPTAVVGPGAEIVLPDVDGDQVDFEGEMALVIGARGDHVSRADALGIVAGITICNDVSARSLQKGRPGVRANISLAKSFRTFAPLGPAVTPLSQLESLSRLRLRTLVNGEVRQEATTDQLIFDIPTLIEYLTARVTLLPGDIIATGTPEGVGDVDGRYLAPGDVVRIELEGVGALENPVARASA